MGARACACSGNLLQGLLGREATVWARWHCPPASSSPTSSEPPDLSRKVPFAVCWPGVTCFLEAGSHWGPQVHVSFCPWSCHLSPGGHQVWLPCHRHRPRAQAAALPVWEGLSPLESLEGTGRAESGQGGRRFLKIRERSCSRFRGEVLGQSVAMRSPCLQWGGAGARRGLACRDGVSCVSSSRPGSGRGSPPGLHFVTPWEL